jgi:hypothetical protein
MGIIMHSGLCPCGSGLPRTAREDGYGIFLCYTCKKCDKAKMAKYRSDIMEHYDADEPIEPES